MLKKHIFFWCAALSLCLGTSVSAMEFTWESMDKKTEYEKIGKNIPLPKGTRSVSFSPHEQNIIATSFFRERDRNENESLVLIRDVSDIENEIIHIPLPDNHSQAIVWNPRYPRKIALEYYIHRKDQIVCCLSVFSWEAEAFSHEIKSEKIDHITWKSNTKTWGDFTWVPDGKNILAYSDTITRNPNDDPRETIAIFNTQKKHPQIFDIEKMISAIDCNKKKPSIFATGSTDGSIAIWEFTEKEEAPKVLLTLPKGKASGNPVSEIEWNPKNPYVLASTLRDGTVEIWNIENQEKPSHTFKGEESHFIFTRWNPKFPNVIACIGVPSTVLYDLDKKDPCLGRRSPSNLNYVNFYVNWSPEDPSIIRICNGNRYYGTEWIEIGRFSGPSFQSKNIDFSKSALDKYTDMMIDCEQNND